MDYGEIARMATDGIKFFSDGDGKFTCVTNKGGTRIVNGVEVYRPEVTTTITGLIRSPKVREVDGEMITATDKIGIFTNDVELENGYQVFVDGQKYTIVEARPVRQTGTTVAYRPILRRIAIHG